MEQLIKSLSNGEIMLIDLDLIIGNDCYAQTSILHSTSRCRAFYCFRNDDTREDGEDRMAQDTFQSLCSAMAELLSNDKKDTEIRLKYVFTVTTAEKLKFTFESQTGTEHSSEKHDSLSSHTLKAIINLLTDNIGEFSFLTAFRPYI